MVLGRIFASFVEKSPVSVMVRGVMERVLSAQRLDQLFEKHAERQYTRELLFSTLFDLVCEMGAFPICDIWAGHLSRAPL